MSSEKFDVIIIGGGPAGLTAAYFLARAGFETLVIERGAEPGAKNVFGGRIYSYVLDKHFTGWRKEAPIERWVRREQLTILCGDNKALTLDYRLFSPVSEESYDSFTAFLSKFTAWLAEKAEEEGAMVLTSTLAEDIIFEDGVASGVIAGGEKIEADYVVIAEGVNTLLLERMGVRRKPKPREVGLGIKEVIRLGSKRINEAFGVDEWEGVARLIIGGPLREVAGGAFLYTMRDYVTIGLVVRLSSLTEARTPPRDLIEQLRLHPAIKSLLKDGVLVEYSAHLTRELGIYDVLEKPYGPGYVVVGDAAGFILNTGFTIRGVDMAMESARLAAKAITRAHEEGRRDEHALAIYKRLLEESIVMRSLKKFAKTPKLLENERIYRAYPEILCTAFSAAYTTNEEAERMYPAVMKKLRELGISFVRLLGDLWRARDAI
ncbi:MAG: FAD-dependent oxidoreductase [Pyrodictiaceae archaeon]